MNENKDFLGKEPIGKLLFKLAVPTVAAQLINLLYNIVDRIYIGHMPDVGDLALTGVGVCLPILMIITAFSAFAAAGGAPRASIFLGKKDVDSAERTMGGCFGLLLVLSVLLMAVLLLFGEKLLLLFGASENTIVYAAPYLKTYALGTLFVQMTLGMGAFITAQGFSRVSMVSVALGAVLNIVLDPIFIYALDMGVQGAALATILSQAASCVFVISFLLGKKTLIQLRAKHFFSNPKLVLPCLALGSANFMMLASESIIIICFNASLLEYGGDPAVGVMTIASSILQFAMLPLQGIGQGAQPILSYNFGAKNPERIRKTVRLLLVSSMIYSCTVWACVQLFPRVFISMFNSKPELVELAVPAIRIFLGAQLLFGIQIACQFSFISFGNAPASLAVAIVRKFVLLLPLIYILPAIFSQNKVMAVYAAEPVADVIAVTFTAILFLFQFRSAMRKLEEPKTES